MRHFANRQTALACAAVLAIEAHSQYPWEYAHAPDHVLTIDQFYTDSANDVMYAVGYINLNGDNVFSDNSVLLYDNGVWDTLGVLNNEIYSIINWHDTLIVGGGFGTLDTLDPWGIAYYANGQWLPYGDVRYGAVNKLRVINDELYMVGSFDMADGHPCSGIAKRVGGEWVNVGNTQDPSDFIVRDIGEYNGEIVACGSMGVAGDLSGGVLRYDGTNWYPLGGGVGSASGTCMAVYKGELYLGGTMLIGQNIGQGIMRWNGNEWRNLGVGPQQINGSYQYNSTMRNLVVRDNLLFACGAFKFASGVPANFIATYDSLNWCGFTGELTHSPNVIGFYQDTLYYSQSYFFDDTLSQILRFIGDTYSDTCSALQVGVQEVERTGLQAWFDLQGTLQVAGLDPGKNVLELYTAIGQRVYATEAYAGIGAVQQLPHPLLPSGLYLLSVNGQARTAILKQP